MSRLLVLLALTLLVTAPAAHAQPAEPVETPALERTLDALGSAATSTAEGIVGAAHATSAAATGALAALAQGAAALARAAWGAVVSAGAALVEGAVALALAVWAGIATAVGFVGRALASMLQQLAAVVAGGARFCAAHPRESAIVATGAAGAAGVWQALRRFGGLAALAPLYTRLAPGQMLDNEARARVYEHIRANPGKHVSALGEALGLGWGTITYHLARLEESRLVTSRSVHHRKCYFVVGSELDGDARHALAALASDPARRVVDTVRGAPGISQKDLADALGISQALASWHVKRLVKAGVLVATRQGRANALTVAGHVPLTGATGAVATA